MVSKETKEWLSKVDKDLDEAKFLFKNKRPLENVAFFIHQAIEKYLKGFLLSKGWELEKINDLVRLVREACKYDRSFEKFIQNIEEITGYYIESRYPIGYDVEFTINEIRESLKIADSIGKLVKTKLGKKVKRIDI